MIRFPTHVGFDLKKKKKPFFSTFYLLDLRVVRFRLKIVMICFSHFDVEDPKLTIGSTDISFL